MKQPNAMYHEIANDIVDAEDFFAASVEAAANIDDAAVVQALRSIAASQLAIAKLMLRREEVG